MMSNYNLVSQIAKVNALHEQLRDARNLVYSLENVFKREEKVLQKHCSHPEFDVESDGDCHSSGYYYTCKTCGYFTKIRPQPAPRKQVLTSAESQLMREQNADYND